jgi:hypothetical protein
MVVYILMVALRFQPYTVIFCNIFATTTIWPEPENYHALRSQVYIFFCNGIPSGTPAIVITNNAVLLNPRTNKLPNLKDFGHRNWFLIIGTTCFWMSNTPLLLILY